MQFEVGQIYERPCAMIRMDDGQRYTVPVLDHLHADPQFGFPDEHYHIDGRFELHPRLKHWFKVENGHTATVIPTGGMHSYTFEGLGRRQVKCERLGTGLTFPGDQKESMANYRNWYAGYVGKDCKGKRCPHFGTEMLERDGQLVCPLHELTADADTLKIIPLERKLKNLI